jgi:hypothetical protein
MRDLFLWELHTIKPYAMSSAPGSPSCRRESFRERKYQRANVLRLLQGAGKEAPDIPRGQLASMAMFVTGFFSLYVVERFGRALDQRL